MRKIATVAACLATLGACTNTLKPIGTQRNLSAFSANQSLIVACQAPATTIRLNELVSPDTDPDAIRLKWLNCEMMAKAMANIEQAGELKNRNEWRDIPLMASALTAAALVLFGGRDVAGNLLPGEVEALEIIGFGTAGFVLLSNYLSPDEAARLLYMSADGHRCLAEHGQAVAAYGPLIVNKQGDYASVVSLRRTVATEIARSGSDAQKQAAREEIDRADAAIAFFVQQKSAREAAPARSFTTSFDFGVELTKRARRQAQSLSDINTVIAQQVRLQQQNAGIGPAAVPPTDGTDALGALQNALASISKGRAVPPPPAVPKLVTDTQQLSLATTALSNNLPNLALLVNGMTLCRTNALAGAALPVPQVRYFGVGTPGE